MKIPPIGVDIDDFRLPVKDALHRAAELNLRHVELSTVVGDLAPNNLSPSGRRHLLRLFDQLGLKLAALTADIPRIGLTDPKTVDERVQRTLQIIDLSRDLGVRMVTSAVGALTHPQNGQPSPSAIEALRQIGEHADSRGIIYAIRPSFDSEERLSSVLNELRCPSIGICLDPAAMIMSGANPIAVVEHLSQHLRLVHARDGTVGLAQQPGQETVIGQGDVDFTTLAKALTDLDYHEPLILRRQDSQTPTNDISTSRDRLISYFP
ncbi:MAG: sugar phosphate isomerase/epimerase family protein [Planctomycetota bacterium]